jgi:FAD-dependent oxidoreductase domain-containing protein 1
MKTDVDVLIVGGGVIGSACATFLLKADPGLSITVIEPDSTYEFAASLKASGGVRRLFALPENIKMSQYSIDWFQSFHEHVEVADEAPDLNWKPGGYLFIVPPNAAQVAALERHHALQRKFGVEVEMFDRDALKRRYPSLHVDDLGAATLSPQDGWLDPNAVLQGLRKKARSLGATYLDDRVVSLETEAGLVRSATLASGKVQTAGHFVNCAGAWAKQICAMVDIPLPVEPMRRFDTYFEFQGEIEPLPYIKDLSRLAMRPEGRGFTAGLVDWNEPRGFNFEIDHDYFRNVVWPAAAHRVPAFETIKEGSTWTGLYDQNELDANMILGRCPGRLDNFLMAVGFSGHGLMHAPSVGRAMTELILGDGFKTIDLSRMSYQRVIDNAPYREDGIV